MKKTYVYQQSIIVSNLLYLGLAIIIGIVPAAMLGIPEDVSEWLLFLFFILLAISLAVAIIVSIVNKLKSLYEVDENGIYFKSMFKNIFIAWSDVKSIQRKYLQWGAYGPYGESQPRDLLIESTDGQKIKVFDCLDDNAGSDKGLSDFETQISDYTNGRIRIK